MHAFRASLDLGAAALKHATERLDAAAAERVVDSLVRCSGRRFCTGVGKSGHAAARMASSLSSIGLASHWVHGAEWAHGELGALGPDDLVLAVSHSGTTKELLWLAEQLQQCEDRIDLLTFTGEPSSPLARRSTVALACEVPAGSEVLGVIPTASTLVTHHVFNAVLSECCERTALTSAEVLRHHPGGQIGARLRSELGRPES